MGAANGANPVAIVVPCHRVIGSNGRLVGYGGGLDRKRWLLAHEGGPVGGRRLPAAPALRMRAGRTRARAELLIAAAPRDTEGG